MEACGGRDWLVLTCGRANPAPIGGSMDAECSRDVMPSLPFEARDQPSGQRKPQISPTRLGGDSDFALRLDVRTATSPSTRRCRPLAFFCRLLRLHPPPLTHHTNIWLINSSCFGGLDQFFHRSSRHCDSRRITLVACARRTVIPRITGCPTRKRAMFLGVVCLASMSTFRCNSWTALVLSLIHI